MLMMIKCILYPGIKLFITSGGKEQAASIASEKITEIIDMIPALRNEIDWSPGKTKLNSKDYVEVFFKNGSKFDVVAAKNSSRGGRRHGGLIDEVSKIAFKYLFYLVR